MPIYLNIPNIPGDSVSKAFPNQFLLANAQWGASNGVQVTSSGVKTGVPSFAQITVQKLSQIQSPNLMLALASGKNLGTVVITTTTTAGSTEVPVEVITLSNAFLSGYEQSLEPGAPTTESLSFAFTRIDFMTVIFNTDGSVKTKIDHFWDIVTNKGG